MSISGLKNRIKKFEVTGESVGAARSPMAVVDEVAAAIADGAAHASNSPTISRAV